MLELLMCVRWQCVEVSVGEFLCACKLYSQLSNCIMCLLACNCHSIISPIVNKINGSHHQ